MNHIAGDAALGHCFPSDYTFSICFPTFLHSSPRLCPKTYIDYERSSKVKPAEN